MLSLGDGEGNIHKPKGARVFPPPLVTYPCSVENLRGSVRYLSMQASSDKNRLQQFTILALAVSKRVLPNHGSKFAPKTYTQPQLLACLLLKEYLRLYYRTTQEMLELSDGLRSALQLSRTPDHSTLWWFARHKLKPAHYCKQPLKNLCAALSTIYNGPLTETMPMRVMRQRATMAPHRTNAQLEWWHWTLLACFSPTAHATSGGERSVSEDSGGG